MPRPPSKYPTELELEILKILWDANAATVREVRDTLAPIRDLAYTSVMTTMNIMVDKGYVTRRRTGPSYVYEPAVTEDAITKTMVRDLVDRAFEGSASALLLQLLDEKNLDPGELKELRRIINRKAREQA